MRKLQICLFAVMLLFTTQTFAHPGRTDKYGGHTESATGRYHIHNEDGTITYTEKPTEAPAQSNVVTSSSVQSAPAQPVQPSSESSAASTATGNESIVTEAPASQSPTQSASQTDSFIQSKTTPVSVQEPTPEAQTPPEQQIQTTITVGDVTKPLQEEAIVAQTVQTEETLPEITNVYHYVKGDNPFAALNTISVILLVFFALIGICMLSSVIYLALKKIEGKSQTVDFLLYIPFVIVIIPSFLGNMLYKLYKTLEATKAPDKESQNYANDDFIQKPRRSNYRQNNP